MLQLPHTDIIFNFLTGLLLLVLDFGKIALFEGGEARGVELVCRVSGLDFDCVHGAIAASFVLVLC
jgi:hypothetical protein